MSVRSDAVQSVLGALERAGIDAAKVGSLEEGTGVSVDGSELAVPDSDPFWRVYTDLADSP